MSESALLQLAPYPGGNNTLIADIRDVQLNTTLADPNSAIAPSMDLGDLYSPNGAIHPRYVGAVWARCSLGRIF